MQGGRCAAWLLGKDLRTAAHLADLGALWRDELDAYATATGSVDLRRTMAVLQRTESLGASLADARRELAATVRQERRRWNALGRRS